MPSTSSVSPSAEEKLTCTSSISNLTKKFKPGYEVGTQFQIWCLKLSSLPLISAETQSKAPAAFQRCFQFFISSLLTRCSRTDRIRGKASGDAEMLSIYSCV